MSELILIDRETQREIGRRAMHGSERFDLYRQCSEHTPLLFQGHWYTLHAVAWRIPNEDLIAIVTFQSAADVDD